MCKRFLILSSVIWLLSGCQTLTLPSDSKPPIPETKLQPCQKPTPLKSGSHNDVESWAVSIGGDYLDCSDRMDDLIDAVRNRQDK